jgi:hypothetical protein
VSDAATAVHYYEALLATFSILLWHFYMVIFDPLVYPMDTAWLNGKVPADHYEHSRPAYFRALKRARLIEAPTPLTEHDEMLHVDTIESSIEASGGHGSENKVEEEPAVPGPR